MLNEEKFSKFVDAIAREAEARYAEIVAETDAYIESETARAKEELSAEYEQILQNKIGELTRETSRQLLLSRNKNRAALISRREECKCEIFDSVRAKLAEFVEGEEYGVFLENSARNATRVQKNIQTIALNSRDKRYFERMKKQISESVELICDDTILLGGARYTNAEKTVLIDDSLDSRLEEQYDWFASASGFALK